MIDKYEASSILIKEILKDLAFNWTDGRKLELSLIHI